METTATTNDKQGLASSLRHMIDEADLLLKTAADTGDQAFGTARDKITDQLRQMRAQLEELEETAAYRAKRAARAADLTVRDHPYEAIGIAAAVGLLIGFLAARR